MIKTGVTDDLERRLYLVKTSSNAIEQSRNIWKSRLPLRPENFSLLKNTLKEMYDLAEEIKKLPLTLSKFSIDKRCQYIDSFLSIPKEYLEKIRKIEKQYRKTKRIYPYKLDTENFLFDYALFVMGINDISVSIINAEKVWNGDLTLEKMKDNAKIKIKDWDYYITRNFSIANKSPRGVAETTWGVLYYMNPIIEIDDKNVLYEKISIGNFDSWKFLNQRRNTAHKYFEQIKNNWKERNKLFIPRRPPAGYKAWVGDVCYPELLFILAASEIRLLLSQSSEQEKKLDYVS